VPAAPWSSCSWSTTGSASAASRGRRRHVHVSDPAGPRQPHIASGRGRSWTTATSASRRSSTPREVDPDEAGPPVDGGTDIDYDLLVAILPHRGVDLVEAAGLGDRGWVEVDKHTLEAENAEHVYALGDTADTGMPNAGSVAHYQAGVVAQRIASEVRGRPATTTYDGKTLCFIETGMDAASFVEFDFERPPSPAPPSRKLHWSKLAYNEAYWLTARGLL